ncbi:MAG TPA: hypothetical protein DCK76_03840 [Desulfotomaculum sp.]|nr:MAG: Putative membrane protein [Desulfotomaculum sp. 46_80]HAG10518.1 hypothetical protein [Desulfotomaculum sp.]HBY04059.1 hypothetical protein [Desulfotomaculum sp.]
MSATPFRNFVDIRFILFLYLLHFGFICLTVVTLNLLAVSFIVWLIYLSLLFYLGYRHASNKNRPLASFFLCGAFGQLPAIILSLLIAGGIFSGSYFKLTIFNTYDFLLQVWHTSLAPLFTLLPSSSILEIPLYYWVTIAASFFYPLVFFLGAVLGFFSRTKTSPAC